VFTRLLTSVVYAWILSCLIVSLIVTEGLSVTLKFKDAPVLEVVDALSDQFGFSYVIEYPDFRKLKNDELKEIFFTPISSELQSQRYQHYINLYQVESEESEEQSSSSSSSTSSTSSGSITAGVSATESEPLKLGSDFEKRLISFYVKTSSAKEAIKVFCDSADVDCEYDESRNFLKIMPYRMEIFDVSFFFDYMLSHSLGLGSISSGSATFTGAGVSYGSAGEGASFGFAESFEQYIKEVISGLRSKEGRVYLSKRGYVVVIDRPSYVEKIKKVWQKEMQKQGEIFLNVKVVRVDLNNEYETGINWNGLITNIFGIDNTMLNVSGSFTFTGDGISLSFDSSKLDVFFKALERYGDVKIIYDWNVKSRGGIPVVFADVQSIPYLTQSLTTTETGVVTSSTPEFVDVGFRISVMGSFVNKGNETRYEGQTFISLSDLISLENLGTSTEPYIVPNVKFSSITVPFTLKHGESIIISSFKIDRKEIEKRGVPILMHIPLFGGLFSYNKDVSSVSEVIVIITPRRNAWAQMGQINGNEKEPVIIYKKAGNNKQEAGREIMELF